MPATLCLFYYLIMRERKEALSASPRRNSSWKVQCWMSALSSEDSLESDKSEEMKAKLPLPSVWSIAHENDQSAEDEWDFLGSVKKVQLGSPVTGRSLQMISKQIRSLVDFHVASTHEESKMLAWATAENSSRSAEGDISTLDTLKNYYNFLLLWYTGADRIRSLVCSTELVSIETKSRLNSRFPSKKPSQKPRFSLISDERCWTSFHRTPNVFIDDLTAILGNSIQLLRDKSQNYRRKNLSLFGIRCGSSSLMSSSLRASQTKVSSAGFWCFSWSMSKVLVRL